MQTETIAAIATALTDSGIGIIRVSGKNAISIVNILFLNKSGRRILFDVKSHTIHYGFIYDVEDKNRYKNILLVLLIEIIYSLSMVINKFLMEYRFCSPYEISFSQGIFGLIINTIFSL